MKKIIGIVLVILVLIICTSQSFAANSEFSLTPSSQEDKCKIAERIKLSVLTIETVPESIVCFDVSNNGQIAVGCISGNQRIISIYSCDGMFEYGFTFEGYGDFGIGFENEYINIYLVRSDLKISLDSEGNIIDIFNIENTYSSNKYWREVVFSDTRIVNNEIYKLKRAVAIYPTYSKITITNISGDERVFINNDGAQIFKFVFITIGVLIFITIVCFSLVRLLKQCRKNITDEQT